jgi:protein ImuB
VHTLRRAVLWCPQWPIVAAGAAVDEPVAVVHANRVVARSLAAAAAGVKLGLRRREAQARCPEVRLVAYEPLVDRRAFQPVADAVARFVPRLELDHPGTLTFLTRGPARYFGGEAAMAAQVLAAVDEVLGDALRAAGPPGIGIADSRFAADVAARTASRAGARGGGARGGGGSPSQRVAVVDADGAPPYLAARPVRWLLDAGGVDADLVELFARLGIHCLGDLASLAEADVVARFGHPGVAAWQMAAGLDRRPVGAEPPPEGLAMVQHFDTPVQHLDVVVFAGRQLAEQLVTGLASAGRVCTQFVVVAETDHGEVSERMWSLSTGFTAGAMVERLRWQLDGWARLDPASVDLTDPDPDLDPLAESGVPTSGIIQLRIEPTELRADDGVQLGLWGGRTQADDWARRAATRLAGLIGDDQVVVAEWRGGRHPADVHRWVPASLSARLDPGTQPRGPAGSTGSTGSAGSTGGPTGSTLRPPWPGGLPMPSPATVHAEPVAVTVVDGRGRPVTVSGRGVVSSAPVAMRTSDGERSGIAAWAGPWVVDERWWDPARHRRLARFQLLMSDGQAHLVSIERSQWWLMATYD